MGCEIIDGGDGAGVQIRILNCLVGGFYCFSTAVLRSQWEMGCLGIRDCIYYLFSSLDGPNFVFYSGIKKSVGTRQLVATPFQKADSG